MTASPIDIYRRQIEKDLQAGNATEHTHRHALKTLIELLESRVTATSQPKRVEYGVADRIVFSGHNTYLEVRCLVTGESE